MTPPLLRILLRSVLLHDPLGVYPSRAKQPIYRPKLFVFSLHAVNFSSLFVRESCGKSGGNFARLFVDP